MIDKDKSFFAKLILAVVIFVSFMTVFGLTACLMKNKRVASLQPQVLISPEPTATPVVNNEIADWKTYRNEEYGFEIKYPAKWYFQNNTKANDLFIGRVSDLEESYSDIINLNLRVEKKPSDFLNFENYLDLIAVEKNAEYSDQYSARYLVDREPIGNSGTNNYVIIYRGAGGNSGASGFVSHDVYFDLGDYFLVASYAYNDSMRGVHINEYNVVQQIIGSFSFIGIDKYEGIISQKSVSANEKAYKFIHYCSGTIKQVERGRNGSEPPPFYCLGENKLVFIGSDGKTLDIKSEEISDAVLAPFLLDTQLLPSTNETGTVLVSYFPAPCLTIGDCGIAEPTDDEIIAFNISKYTFRIIKNYNESETANWNKAGTKAVFYPHTCGGAGCDKRSLIGYSLLIDESKNITSEQAAYDRGGCEDEIACWSDLHWIDDNRVSAIINYPDGSKKEVTASF
ncbi:hypothetical protein KKB43_06045 [Patescibacteria group bacterium]|nr:hypothetical protein [Patescibacteria group bacterium]MBU4580542.1 hypothetical protein [Patescibacteria group bacterium]